MSDPKAWKFEPKFKGDLIGGEFRLSADPTAEWICRSPAHLADEFARVTCSYGAIEPAIQAARDALASWRKTSEAERAGYLRKYQERIKAREAEFIETIAREVGKPLWEAKTEVASMVGKVDITLNESQKLIAGFSHAKILEGTDGVCRYKPHGVMAVVGPFNFPGHLPNGHIVPALAAGNVVIFKPSEKTPLTGQLIAECMMEAGLPAGVFGLLHGDKEVGRRLVVHEHVDGVLFTGSYEVGTRIKQDTLQQHWKILALEMGGKNPSIVWEDAEISHAIHECLTSAFLTTGQRCSATSRILVHSSRIEQFLETFHARAKAFAIGHPLDEPFMGPLIDSSSVDRFMKFQGIAVREGAEQVMRGKPLESVNGRAGHYVTPGLLHFPESSLEATRKSVFQQTELFGPAVAVLGFTEIEEAIAQANATQYGLAASVFSSSRAVYDKCVDDLEMGCINWNRSTVGASSRLPFGGLKKSGNHQPTALSASLYCAYPVASLEQATPKAVTQGAFPGMNWT